MITFHQEPKLDFKAQPVRQMCASSSSQHITKAFEHQKSDSEAVDKAVPIFDSEANINKCASIESLNLHQDDLHGFDYFSLCDASFEISDDSISDFDEMDRKQLFSLLQYTADHSSIGKFDNEDEPVMISDDYEVDENYQSPADGGKHVDEIYKPPAHGGDDDDENCKATAHEGNLDDESYKSPAHGGKLNDESKRSPAHGVNNDEDHVCVTENEMSCDHPPSPKSQRISELSNQVLNLESKIEMLKKEKEFADRQILLLKTRPSYPSVSDISSKLLESLKPELDKLVTREDFNGKFSTDVNNLSSQHKEISCKVVELTEAVSKIKFELPKHMIDVPVMVKELSIIISEVKKKVDSIESKNLEVPASLLGLPIKVGNFIDEVSKYKSLESIPLSLEKVENAIYALNASLKSLTCMPAASTDVVMENKKKESCKQLKVSDFFGKINLKQQDNGRLEVAHSKKDMMSPMMENEVVESEVQEGDATVGEKSMNESSEKVFVVQENHVVETEYQQGDGVVGKKQMNEFNEKVNEDEENDVTVDKDSVIEDNLEETEVQRNDGNVGKKSMNESQLKENLLEEPDATVNEGSLMIQTSPVKEIKYKNLKGQNVHIVDESLNEQKRQLDRMYQENVKHEKLKKKAEIIKSFDQHVIDLFTKKKSLYDKYCHIVLNRRAPGKITNADILSRNKGPATLKIYRDDGDEEIIEEFKVKDLHWEEWKEFLDCCGKRKAARWVEFFVSMRKRVDEVIEMKNKLNIQDQIPLQDQDPFIELNRIARKRKRVGDDMEEYFRSTKHFKDQVAYEDHPPGTVLNEPTLGMIIFNNSDRKDFISIEELGNLSNVMLHLVQTIFVRLHKGPGTTDIAKTFSEFVVREAEKRNKESNHKCCRIIPLLLNQVS